MRMLDLEMLRGLPRAAIWLVFGVGAVSACGGSSDSTDKDGAAADADGADDGPGGGQSGGDGDGVGDGVGVGGADPSGGMGGEGSDPSGGSGSGAASSGGSDGSGGDESSGGSSGGEGCIDATCQMVADECPTRPVNGCSATCEMVPDSCAEDIPCANLGARFNLSESDPEEVVRLPSIRMCDGDGMCGVESLYFPIHVFNPSAETLRVTVGPGWQMTPRYMESDDPSGLDCEARSESCVMINPLTVPGSRQIVMTPTTDPPIERNALVEIVPEGTTCP